MSGETEKPTDEHVSQPSGKRTWIHFLDESARFRVSGWFLTFLGTLIGVIAFGCWYSTLERRSVSSYQTEKRPVVTRNPDTSPETAGKIQVLFDGKVVQSPWTCSYEFSNSGNVGFANSDIENATLTLEFGKTKVLLAEQLPSEPDDIHPVVTHDDHVVKLQFKNGNWSRGEKFKVNVILDNEPELPLLHYRIKDVGLVGVKDLSSEFAVPDRPFYTVPRIFDIALSSVATGGLLLLAGSLPFMLFDSIRSSLRQPVPTAEESIGKLQKQVHARLGDSTYLDRRFNKDADELLIGLTKLGEDQSIEFPFLYIESPSSLDDFLSDPGTISVLKQYNSTPEHAKRLILKFVKEDFLLNVPHVVTTDRLPSWYQRIKDAIRQLEFDSVDDLLNKIRKVVMKDPPERVALSEAVWIIILGVVQLVVLLGIYYLVGLGLSWYWSEVLRR